MNYYLYFNTSGYRGQIGDKFFDINVGTRYLTKNLEDNPQITPPAVGIVHESDFKKDSNEKSMVELLTKCGLVIFFTGYHSRPEKHDSAPVQGPVCWKCHPQFIVKHFDRLVDMLEGGPDAWDINKWVLPWPESLVSAYLLQLAAQKGVDCNKIANDNDFWDKAGKEFKEQNKQLGGQVKPIQGDLTLANGYEDVKLLLSEIAKAKMA